MGLLAEIVAEAKLLQAPPASQAAPLSAIYGEVALADPIRALFPPGQFYVQYNPSALVGARGMAVFDRMRNDDQVKAALSFKKDAALATGWRVDSPDGFPDEWEVTEFVREQLDGLEGTLQANVRAILSALDYGFSVTEKVYGTVGAGRFAGLISLAALKSRRPHEFQFVTDTFGNLEVDGLIQYGNPMPKLPTSRFVLFVHEFEFGNWYGRSDLEAAFRPWWAKENSYKFLVILLERLGVPPVIALYDPGRFPPPLDNQLKTALKNLQANTTGMIPRMGGAEGLEMWVPEAAGQATRVFTPALEMFNQDIARALLMPGHLGLTADMTQGSLARARVNFDMFMLTVQRLRDDVQERAVNEQIVRPLVDLNFPGVQAYPGWRLLPATEEQRLDLMDRWFTAVTQGVVTPQPQDEEHVREQLKFPKRAAEAPFHLSARRYALRRPNRLERHVNFERIERTLDGIEAKALDDVRRVILDSRDQLLAFVERRIGEGRQTLVDDVKFRNSAELGEALRAALEEAFRTGARELRAELPKTFQTGPMFTPTEALRWLARRAELIGTEVSGRLLERVRKILMNALKFGEPQRETIEKLKKAFEDHLGEPGVTRRGDEIEPHRLETILRTNATEAFNQGRLVQARDPEVEPLMRGMEYSAVIDTRTTEVCRFLDGKIFRMGEPEMDRLAPPNHFNCRSVLVPVTVDMTVDEREFITAAELGRAEELAQEGFK